MQRRVVSAGLVALWTVVPALATSPYAQWTNGPPTDPNFFAIGVWYQNLQTSVINGYAAMHVNVYIYPDTMNATALTWIHNAGMYTVTLQDSFGLSQVNNKTIIGWFNPPDEPDNAQWNATTQSYDPPILPATIISQYNTLKANDPTRPVQLNLGQGVAWNYIGRGVRSQHPEDYPATTTFTWVNGQVYHQGYVAGSDIAAFDIYPMNEPNTASYASVFENLSIVGYGVSRLVSWSAPNHPVWNYIETGDIQTQDSSPGPTPAQVKAEVWLSLVHGSLGIMYFCHSWSGSTQISTHKLLDDPVMNPAVTAINAQIRALAPALNSTTALAGTITTGTPTHEVSLDFMTKHDNGSDYLFTVADQNSNGIAFFKDPAMAGVNATVDVLGENRTLSMVHGAFIDAFSASAVHLYEIEGINGFTPQLIAPIPAIPGDFDQDGDVDADDFAVFKACWSGPDVTYAGDCGRWDFDHDGDVDLEDFAVFQRCYSGRAKPADPNCAR